MKKDNSGRGTRTQKVIPLYESEPLLKTIGHETLTGMITPEEAAESKELLEKFIKDAQGIDVEKKVILAYRFGVMQGVSDMYEERAGKALADRILNAYRMGQHVGMMVGMLLFPKGKDS